MKGITLCDEYYKRPEATEEAFKDEWLGLGDMGIKMKKAIIISSIESKI